MAELTRGQILKNPEILGTTTSAGKIRIYDGDESNYIDVQAATTITSNYTLVLPATTGTSGQVLQTDGTGVTSWQTVSASPGGSSGQLQYNGTGTFAGTVNITTDGTNLTLRTTGELRFNETDNTNYVAFKAPGSVGGDRTYTLPDTIGTVGQVLKIASGRTDNAATLVWQDDATGGSGGTPGGADGYVQFNVGGTAFGGDADFTYNSSTNALTVAGLITAGGINVTTGNDYKINNVSVLTNTTLGSSVTASSLTSVGTLSLLNVSNIRITDNSITATNTNGNLSLASSGTGVVQSLTVLEVANSGLRLRDADASNYVEFKTSATVVSNYTLTFPQSIGSNDEVLAFSSSGAALFVSNYRALNFIIDGGGTVIGTGVQGYVQVHNDCQIQDWTLLGDTNGAIVVDIWKDTFANYPPTVADTITAAAKPSITGIGNKNSNATLTGWTTTINAGDILAFNVDSVSTFTRMTVVLRLKAI